MSKKPSFKIDKFRKNRGGHSRWLLLSCEKCKHPVAHYQKDGPGILKRLYVDRMIGLRSLADKQLTCKKCQTVLGVRMIYKKEGREAYRLFAGAVEKKIVKSNALSNV